MTMSKVTAEGVHTYLELLRLLDGIQHDHPEVSAPLRLALQRARREGQLGALDDDRFRSAIAAVGPGALG